MARKCVGSWNKKLGTIWFIGEFSSFINSQYSFYPSTLHALSSLADERNLWGREIEYPRLGFGAVAKDFKQGARFKDDDKEESLVNNKKIIHET